MNMSISMVTCKPAMPSLKDVPRQLDISILIPRRRREKVVVILGATGTGKSRLSIDIASRFPAEIVNSDKMQVYEGLDVVTNKVTEEEKCGVPHHLLGNICPDADFTTEDFCCLASLAVDSISARGQHPIIVGGSNSYVEALVNDPSFHFRSRYECCFLWVDVAMPVLHSFVSERVDRMVEKGLIEEVGKVFDPDADYSRGVKRAIGVPELDLYFRTEKFLDESNRKRLLEDAIAEIKYNTCKLACRQLEKIHRLRNFKRWNVHRLDATQVFQRQGGAEADEAWRKLVIEPSTKIVAEFLYGATKYPPLPRALAAAVAG
ncbi:hypothetical protein MLD38_033057 [Melastoma candidum]|uniref:Uncharacterized protein n=2 Tax=Melastoma candidum TaxID=119954 RepID=A0ACB9M5I2_9MYRT|nr:hypothetical protein MLD38_033057 [Melastoma candidum]